MCDAMQNIGVYLCVSHLKSRLWKRNWLFMFLHMISITKVWMGDQPTICLPTINPICMMLSLVANLNA